MKAFALSILLLVAPLHGAIPGATSPDGRLAIVLDVDRDPTIELTWKGDGFPKLEITDLESGRILSRLEYRGEPMSSSDIANLGRMIRILWRPDSSAVAISFILTHGCTSVVAVRRDGDAFRFVEMPSWEAVLGGPAPEQPISGCESPERWDDKGSLVVSYFLRHRGSHDGAWECLDYRVWVGVDTTRGSVMRFERQKEDGEPGATDNPGDAQ